MDATSSSKIDGWDEQAYHEDADGRKLTRAHVAQTLRGDIDGRGDVQWLMCYRPDDTADFVGLQRIAGRIGQRSGGAVLETSGTFDGRQAAGPLRIVPGSGTGQLRGISGEGRLRAPLGGEPEVALTYRFA